MKLSLLMQKLHEHRQMHRQRKSQVLDILQSFLAEAKQSISADNPDPSLSFQAFVMFVKKTPADRADSVTENDLLSTQPDALLFQEWQTADIENSLQPVNTQILLNHLQTNLSSYSQIPVLRAREDMLVNLQHTNFPGLEVQPDKRKEVMAKHLSASAGALPANKSEWQQQIEEIVASKPSCVPDSWLKPK